MRNKLHILITAGPTQEALDPVRFLTNRSSGKMGYALAEAAKKEGHQVTLVSGPTCLTKPRGVRSVDVTTAREMYRAVMRNYKKADVMILCAAVADYRPVVVARQKIKKSQQTISLRMVRNPDILAALGRRKRRNQLLIGFAAETDNVIANAQAKLKKKKCDFIVANRVGKKGSGFEADTNDVSILSRKNRIKIGNSPKDEIAKQILSHVLSTWQK